jgi:MFS family permease
MAVLAATSTRARSGLRALCAATALGGLAQALAGTGGALLARQISGSTAVAGLPQTALVAGSAAAALALSALTRRHGRAVALATGAVLAVAGCIVVAAAAVAASLPLVLAGSLLLGSGNTAVMLGRYAAADLAPDSSRARAMATVLAATTVGAVAGPNLLVPATGLAAALGLPPLAGPYLLGAVGFTAAAGVLIARLGPVRPPAGALAPVDPPRRAPAMAGPGPAQTTGLAVLSLANLVMVAVMTMAPVQLHRVGGSFGVIGLVVSLHIAGMFAPSPASGWLTDRFGATAAANVAAVVLLAATGLAALRSDSPPVLAAAMTLLGVGWNLGLIAGSALLTAGVPAVARPRLEGWGELGMGVAAAAGGAASGPVMAGGGYSLLAGGGALAAAFVLPAARRPHSAPTHSAPPRPADAGGVPAEVGGLPARSDAEPSTSRALDVLAASTSVQPIGSAHPDLITLSSRPTTATRSAAPPANGS